MGKKLKLQAVLITGLSKMTEHIMHNALVPSTREKYTSIEKKWLSYCGERRIDPMIQGTVEFLNFLSSCLGNKSKWGYLRSLVGKKLRLCS